MRGLNREMYEYVSGFDRLPSMHLPASYINHVFPYIFEYIRHTSEKSHKKLFIDLASGYSATAELIKHVFPECEVIASDISFCAMQGAANRTRKNDTLVHYLQMLAGEISIGDGQVSVLHMKDALTHIYDKKSFFLEAHRVLRKDGLLVLTFVVGGYPVFKVSHEGFNGSIPLTNLDEYFSYQERAMEAKKENIDFYVGPPYFGVSLEEVLESIDGIFNIEKLGSWVPYDEEAHVDWYQGRKPERTKLILRKK